MGILDMSNLTFVSEKTKNFCIFDGILVNYLPSMHSSTY